MAWRTLTLSDLTDALSTTEATIFQRHSDSVKMDGPAEDILYKVGELVRSYCRSNGRVRLSPHAAEIPESLVAPAIDYAIYDLLKRMPIQINEPRTKARENALAVFRDVAAGRLLPEQYGDAPDTPGSTAAVQVAVSSRRRVTGHSLEGL